MSGSDNSRRDAGAPAVAPGDLAPAVPAGSALTALLGFYLLAAGVISISALVAIFPTPLERVVVVVETRSETATPEPGSIDGGRESSRGGVANTLDAPAIGEERADSSLKEGGGTGRGAAEQTRILQDLEFGPIPWAGIRPSVDQGLLLLALLAGILGSLIHATQSFAGFVGNRELKRSWAFWYFMRPLVGGILGLVFYAVVRGGLLSGQVVVNPYGVIALGALAGWFSKKATEKLMEVFDALFPTTVKQLDPLTSPAQGKGPGGGEAGGT